MTSVSAVVVTYNRKELLLGCLNSILLQSKKPCPIYLIDNNSTDGTRDVLMSGGWLNTSSIEVLQLRENVGGAGGFSVGLEVALRGRADWIWIMDDDAEPYPNALEELMKIADDPNNIYASLAVRGNETSWLTTVVEPPLGEISLADEIPPAAVVQSLPFLGFLIHRQLIERIGLPDVGYFIAADDVEYCLRAQKAGAKLIIAGASRIEHPKSRPYKVKIFGRTLTCLALPPWKRYYDTRNRIFIARKHYGLRLFTQTLPASFVRMLATLFKEPRKLAQLWAWSCGMLDGVLGIKGRRHGWWKIKV